MGNKNIFSYLYPVLLAAYPILALRQSNLEYVNMSVTVRALSLTLLAAGICWVFLARLLKNWHKAGIISALGVLLFYSYGHIYLWGRTTSFGSFHHSLLSGAFGLALALAVFFVIRQQNLDGLVRFLNISSLTLTCLILLQFTVHAVQVQRSSQDLRKRQLPAQAEAPGTPLPDIYLIILDAHTRSDVLQQYYDYDDSKFISSLEAIGFYVSKCSQSNYPGTNFSLISLMNMDYFYNLFDQVQVFPALKHSAVSETVRELGYTVIAFENRATGHFDLMEDIYLSRNPTVFENISLGGGFNEFESMLIETSFLRIFLDMPNLLPKFLKGQVKDAELYEHYLQTYFILDELKNVPAMPGPKFVLAHIMTPHDPYIFIPEGGYKPSVSSGPIVGYRNNVRFIDNFLPQTLQAILQNSSTPPIIVVMGDHGPTGLKEVPEARLKILNAYYVNDETRENLYPTITPVNSFRVIFNAYFDTQYPLREDTSHMIWSNNQILEQGKQFPNLCQP